jgi:hypothetical protein
MWPTRLQRKSRLRLRYMLNKPDETDDSVRNHPVLGTPLDASRRIALAVVALPFGLLSAWMVWIVHRFLDGKGWFDVIVGAVLNEFILAVGLFALILLVGAVFAPTWLARAFAAVTRKLVRVTTLVILLLVGVFLIVMFVQPVLVRLGVLQ